MSSRHFLKTDAFGQAEAEIAHLGYPSGGGGGDHRSASASTPTVMAPIGSPEDGIDDGDGNLRLVALRRFVEFDLAEMHGARADAVGFGELRLVALPHVGGHGRGRDVQTVAVHDEDLGDAPAGRIDPAAQEIRRALCRTGSIVGVAEADLGPPGEVQRVDLRLIESGILGVLARIASRFLGRLRPCADFGVEKRLHGGANSLAADGVAAIAARSAMAGKRMRSTFLSAITGVGPDSGLPDTRAKS
jgi:hypothetical protein